MLKRLGEKKEKTFTTLKSLSSLLTHAVIECEHGNLEYRKLIPLLMERLNDASFSILSKGV